MALHVIIPARYGSSRFPGKPLVKIAGKPMIQHVMERASQAQGVMTVAVATDDERVAQAVEAFGGKALMTPSHCRSGSDRVALAAEPGLGLSTPVVAITNPEEIPDPNHVKTVMDVQGNALYFSRLPVPHPRDGDKITYYKHLGVYIFRREFLAVFAGLPTGRLEQIEKLEQLRALEHGHKVRCVVTGYDSPEVDRPEDALRVEALLRQAGGDW